MAKQLLKQWSTQTQVPICLWALPSPMLPFSFTLASPVGFLKNLFIWLYHVLVVALGSSVFVVACRIFSYNIWDLALCSGIEPGSLALGLWSVSHWTNCLPLSKELSISVTFLLDPLYSSFHPDLSRCWVSVLSHNFYIHSCLATE